MVGQPSSEVLLGSNESRALAWGCPREGWDTCHWCQARAQTRELRARVGLEGKGLLHNTCKGLLSYTIPEKLWRDIKPS